MVPNLAADNLYKFVAIFGLVMVLFAVTYPIQLMQEDKAKIAATEKETAILNVGMENKRETVKRFDAEVRKESERLVAENATLLEKSNQLDEKTKALERQKKLTRTDNPALVEALARITDEQGALQNDVAGRRSRVGQLRAEMEPVKNALDRANDELQIGNIELAAQSRLLEGETRHYQVAGLLFLLFGLGGIYMCIKGFALWYHRVQRHHDAILDKHVKDEGLITAKGATKKP